MAADSALGCRRSRRGCAGTLTGPSGNRPVTIRYLDPPLHEFLPATSDQKKDLADKLKVPFAQVDALGSALHESNPMLGHREQ